ncbi:HPr family phosphocarrier protein [Smaragdicoccus niigatensis]|uniref:HPr family phosphocarrier protein n=1 Tax=Smaragdicoccus niigatensis TaxID=359359 RepID=UPI00036B2CA6|nr:HPr family phosphocarrier protein [Smaragdicoccus niigatensis]
MASTTVVVGSAIGLHARPAAIIAEAAAKYEDEILIEFDDEEADAASALMIMALGAENGAVVTVTSDNEEALTEIVALVAQDLDA